uniref:Uncharacterized protein n=1 Tax=Cacopsylla melanoneura TaxID=428564 RepID=A0A8D8YED3_9HEMI
MNITDFIPDEIFQDDVVCPSSENLDKFYKYITLYYTTHYLMKDIPHCFIFPHPHFKSKTINNNVQQQQNIIIFLKVVSHSSNKLLLRLRKLSRDIKINFFKNYEEQLFAMMYLCIMLENILSISWKKSSYFGTGF